MLTAKQYHILETKELINILLNTKNTDSIKQIGVMHASIQLSTWEFKRMKRIDSVTSNENTVFQS